MVDLDDQESWLMFGGEVFMTERAGIHDLVGVLVAIQHVYETSEAYEQWFTRQEAVARCEITFGWSEFEPPTEGKVRVMKARGESPTRITYEKLFSDETLSPRVSRQEWLFMLAEHDEAFDKVQSRLGLEPRPMPPTIEQAEPFYRPLRLDEGGLPLKD